MTGGPRLSWDFIKPMKILFNLASQRGALSELSKNDIGLAHSILSRVCMDNGLPVGHGGFDTTVSPAHSYVYESIRGYAEEKLFCIPTPDIAVLSDLGNLQFQLTLHNRE